MITRRTKSSAEWRAHWDTRARVTDRVAAAGYCVGGKPVSPREHNSWVERWLSLLDVKSQFAVLEVGFGPAIILDRLEQLCEHVAGIDLSPAMVARYSGTAEVKVAEANDLPFPAEAFDRVLLASVAHYFPDTCYLRASISEIARVLRPGGLALFADVPVEPPSSGAPYMWYRQADIATAVAAAECTYHVVPDDVAVKRVRCRIDIVMTKPRQPHPRAVDRRAA